MFGSVGLIDDKRIYHSLVLYHNTLFAQQELPSGAGRKLNLSPPVMITPVVFLSAIAINDSIKVPAPKVDQLAATTGLPIATEIQLPTVDFYLYWRDEKLTLRDQSTADPVDICIDFCAGKNKHRLQFGGSFGQPLARAINAKPDKAQLICDATGGLGQDAFVFASLGCRVVIFERSMAVFALLSDGIQRALNDTPIAPIAQRLELYHLDSQHLAEQWPHDTKPDTVYLDPMYPHSSKSAAAKKGMQTLQHLLPVEKSTSPLYGDKLNEEQTLLNAALATAIQRVVVKRPAKAPPLANSNPVGSIKSPNTRYDIYKPHS